MADGKGSRSNGDSGTFTQGDIFYILHFIWTSLINNCFRNLNYSMQRFLKSLGFS